MGARILIVDDDRDLVESIRLVLEGKGYDVIAAHDPGEGKVLVEKQWPDLVLLDVMMPHGTEGFHFVWSIRSHTNKHVKGVPIIVLTAIHDKTELRFYPDSGDGTYKAGEYLDVQDFIDKPVDPDKLLDRVSRVLAAGRNA